jgi:CIC family chloride channel protein
MLKLAANLFTLATSGVSAMFVPLFLTGGSIGTAFAQSIIRSSSVDFYAAVGRPRVWPQARKYHSLPLFLWQKRPPGHAFIVPALIGAAVAYAVSGDASASGDQRLHEGEKVREV